MQSVPLVVCVCVYSVAGEKYPGCDLGMDVLQEIKIGRRLQRIASKLVTDVDSVMSWVYS